jgi:hypothetical protein
LIKIKYHYKRLFGTAKYVVECEVSEPRYEHQHPYTPLLDWASENNIRLGWAYNWISSDSAEFNVYFRTHEDQTAFIMRWA